MENVPTLPNGIERSRFGRYCSDPHQAARASIGFNIPTTDELPAKHHIQECDITLFPGPQDTRTASVPHGSV